jgi:prepilin-type N-terminal cleavage/methylation domain-containing protein
MSGASEQNGFTLIEILVVVFMIGILAAVAVPSFSSRPERQAEMEGARIESTIRHAQALAFARNTDFEVDFDSAYSIVKVTKINTGPGPHPPDLDDYSWKLQYGAIVSADFGGVTHLVFTAGGKPEFPGSAVVSYKCGLTLTITVSQETGHVTISGIP